MASNIKQVPKRDRMVTFNWTLRVLPQNAAQAYELQDKLEHASWVEDFEKDEAAEDIQRLFCKTANHK